MPSVLDKISNTLLGLYIFVDTTAGASSTVNAAAAKGATTLTIAAASTFANGQDVRLGSGETQERIRILSGGGTTTLTLVKGLKFDHPVADVVVQQSAVNVGVPEQDGFKLNWAGESSDIFSAVSRLAYATVNGFVDITASWRYPAVTADIFGVALGLPRANVIGNGTLAAQTGTVGPRMFTTDGVLFGAITALNATAAVQLQDGSFLHIDLYNLSVDPTALSVTFARGQLATVPMKVMASSGAIDFTNTVFTPFATVATFASSKDDVFAEITSVSTLTDSGTNTTLTSGVAAGVYVLPVAAVTNINAGTWLRLNSGDVQEYHWVNGTASLNVNLRTQVLRAHATSTAVAVQTVTPLAGIVGGFTFGISGSVNTLRSETIRTSLGYQVTNAAVTLSTNVNALTAVNFYTAMGIPASALVNNVLPIGTSITTAASTTLLFSGVTAGGKTVQICGWQGSAVISGELVVSQSVASQIPMAYKPNGLQVIVNA